MKDTASIALVGNAICHAVGRGRRQGVPIEGKALHVVGYLQGLVEVFDLEVVEESKDLACAMEVVVH